MKKFYPVEPEPLESMAKKILAETRISLEDKKLAIKIVIDDLERFKAGELQYWRNDIYQVIVDFGINQSPGWPKMVHLSIKRNDREQIVEWRDFQEIKNQIMGPEFEAVQLFPAETRLVDTANQYHIWCLASDDIRFPFGWNDRTIANEGAFGAKQKPFTSS